MGSKILVIGDSHADPRESNRRYKWLGRLIVALRPDVIVSIGDMGDFASLCIYDKGQLASEGRRVRDDISALHQALNFINEEIDSYNKDRKYKIYNPRKVYIMGNHEERLNTAGKKEPALHGTLSTDNLGLHRWGWEVIPFLEVLRIERINFVHYIKNPGKQNAMSGVHLAYNILSKKHASYIFGHDHKMHIANQTLDSGRRIISIGAGCYFEHNPEYAGMDSKSWWRGIVMLNNVKDGSFDPEFIGINQIQKKYGGDDDILPIIQVEIIKTEVDCGL